MRRSLLIAALAASACGPGATRSPRNAWTAERLDSEVSGLARAVASSRCTSRERLCRNVAIATTDDGIRAARDDVRFLLSVDADGFPVGQFDGDDEPLTRWEVLSCAFRAPDALALIEPALRRLAARSITDGDVAEQEFLELLGLRVVSESYRPRWAALVAACPCHGKLLRERVPHRLIYFDRHDDGRAVDGFTAVFAGTGSAPAESTLEGVFPLAPP